MILHMLLHLIILTGQTGSFIILVSADNYITYDSSIYFNNSSGGIKTVISDLSYDANKNVTSVRKATYQDGQLFELGGYFGDI